MATLTPDKIFNTKDISFHDTKDSNNVNAFNQGQGPGRSQDPLIPYPQIHQSEIPPGTIKQRHIEAMIIFSGTLANRPANGSTEKVAYFATDNNRLYIWNGTAWVSTLLA
jgi:hypothetical protein